MSATSTCSAIALENKVIAIIVIIIYVPPARKLVFTLQLRVA